MTPAEDEHNAFLNGLIRACSHVTVLNIGGVVRCGRCPASFAVVWFPRLAKPRVFIDEDESLPAPRAGDTPP
jgi:hypothetical protein